MAVSLPTPARIILLYILEWNCKDSSLPELSHLCWILKLILYTRVRTILYEVWTQKYNLLQWFSVVKQETAVILASVTLGRCPWCSSTNDIPRLTCRTHLCVPSRETPPQSTRLDTMIASWRWSGGVWQKELVLKNVHQWYPVLWQIAKYASRGKTCLQEIFSRHRAWRRKPLWWDDMFAVLFYKIGPVLNILHSSINPGEHWSTTRGRDSILISEPQRTSAQGKRRGRGSLWFCFGKVLWQAKYFRSGWPFPRQQRISSQRTTIEEVSPRYLSHV